MVELLLRRLLEGVHLAADRVHSFKQPSKEELDHDFLWRTACRLPERGRIGVFNRSYYEEVLVVRVHPEYLEGQRLPDAPPLDALWAQRYESIADHEKHLARNGTVILKFWLNVSREEQRDRFVARIDEPHKNWKFNDADVEERQYWDAYMFAYQEALRETSRPWAPWYSIPADDKRYMRATVAKIVADTLDAMNLDFPTVSDERREELKTMRSLLESE